MALRFNSNVPESDVLQKYFPQHLKAALSSCGGSSELSAAPLLPAPSENWDSEEKATGGHTKEGEGFMY